MEILRLFLDNGANSTSTDCLQNTALHLAVQKSNNTEMVKYLIEQAKLDVNAINLENQTALHLVSYQGYMPVVEYLIENGALVDVRDKYNVTPLHIAAAYGHLSTLQLLLNKGNIFINRY